MHRLFFTPIEHDALIYAMNRYMALNYQDKDYLKKNFAWLYNKPSHFNMTLKSLEFLYRAVMIEEINTNAFNILSPKLRKALYNVQYKIYNIFPIRLKNKYKGSILYNKC